MTADLAGATTAEARDTTRALLACGVVAGPLFVGTAAVQVLTRDGFDLGRQPISLLSLGDLGWIQVTNFVVAGLLSVAFAVGLRRVLPPGGTRTWGSLLIRLYGVGLVAGGVFVPDPALGFPAGAPDAIPDQPSWHAVVHAVAPPLAFLALIGACLVFARWFAAAGQRGWAVASVCTVVLCLALSAWPDMDGSSVRLAVAVTFGFGFLTALAVWLSARDRLGLVWEV